MQSVLSNARFRVTTNWQITIIEMVFWQWLCISWEVLCSLFNIFCTDLNRPLVLHCFQWRSTYTGCGLICTFYAACNVYPWISWQTALHGISQNFSVVGGNLLWSSLLKRLKKNCLYLKDWLREILTIAQGDLRQLHPHSTII